MTKKQRKSRTSFSVLHKAETLTLLEELNSNGHAWLKIEKKKNKVNNQVVVFHTKQEIAKHYGVSKQAISNLDCLSGDDKQKILQEAALIKENNLNPRKSRIQVLFNLFLSSKNSN